MTPLGDIHRHIQLVNGMAKAHDIDLSAAARDGRLSQEDYAQMVTRCRGCSGPDSCEVALRSTNPPRSAPDMCRNAQVFEALKQL